MATTFTGFCIAACLFVIFFDFGLAFVASTGAFDTELTPTISTTGNYTTVFTRFFKFDFATIWGLGIGVAIIGLAISAIVSVSTTLIAVFLFGTIFWTGWANVVDVFHIGGFLDSSPGIILTTMLTVGMMVMFSGAVIGILSGNPMRE